MIVGIVGLPFCGKTSVFNAVTGENAPVGSYSSSGTTHTATVWVPDVRLERLRQEYEPKKYTPASFHFRDFCVVSGEGEKISDINPAMLADVREVTSLLKVVRGYNAIDGSAPDPLSDLSDIDSEFLFADLGIIEKRVEKLQKSVKRNHLKVNEEKKELILLERCRDHLMSELPISEMELKPEEEKSLRGFCFLTQKPSLVLLNLPEDADGDEARKNFSELMEKHPNTLLVRGSIEMEISQLSEEDREMFMEEMGIKDSATNRVVRACYELLGLLSFFTVGKDEVRAWNVEKGATAVIAAGTIHSDLAKGFIRAEVVNYDKAEPAGYNIKKARGMNLSSLEGKDYIVKDGDIIEIRFNI